MVFYAAEGLSIRHSDEANCIFMTSILIQQVEKFTCSV